MARCSAPTAAAWRCQTAPSALRSRRSSETPPPLHVQRASAAQAARGQARAAGERDRRLPLQHPRLRPRVRMPPCIPHSWSQLRSVTHHPRLLNILIPLHPACTADARLPSPHGHLLPSCGMDGRPPPRTASCTAPCCRPLRLLPRLPHLASAAPCVYIASAICCSPALNRLHAMGSGHGGRTSDHSPQAEAPIGSYWSLLCMSF